MLSNYEWTCLYVLLRSLQPRRIGRGHPFSYPWSLMVWLALWTAAHQWPITELAHQLIAEGWPKPLRRVMPRHLRRRRPDLSTLSRRWRQEAFFDLLDQLLLRMAATDSLASVDGTVLPIGRHSRDSESRFGGRGSGFQKGYKAVRLVNSHGQALAVQIASADRHEGPMAEQLLRRIADRAIRFRRLLGDSLYDIEALRRLAMDRLGALLIAPPYRRGRGRRGHSRLPRTGPLRREVRRLLRSSWGKYWYRKRGCSERSNGWLKQRPHNLFALPAFIRTKVRVRRWVLCHEVLLSYRKGLRLAKKTG